MVKILITGALGFIGRYAALPLLETGHDVHGVTRRPVNDLSESLGGALSDINFHQADLLNSSDLWNLIETVKPDAILHLAWITEHGYYWTATENEDWVTASIELISAFQTHGGRRIVIAGTCAEYDWSDPLLVSTPCNEFETPTNAMTPYGRARVKLFNHLSRESAGLSWGWGRIFFPYGPGEAQQRLVPSVAQALLDGKEAAIGPGDVVRDFMDVRDVGAALATLLLTSVEGPVNIATGEGYTIEAVARRLSILAGCPDLLKVGARPRRENDPPHLVADIDRLANEVGFTPSHDLDAGLLNTLEWWKVARQTERRQMEAVPNGSC
jgi:nucleoside-diphosphate-sugar epimerase